MSVATIRAHRLVYGLAVANGRDSGWKFVASSLGSNPSLEQELIARTHVGLKAGDNFKGGYGYFGDVIYDRHKWAVLCRFERSTTPEATGHHFVQRDIALVPFTPFVDSAGGHGFALRDQFPEGEKFTNLQSVDEARQITFQVRELPPVATDLQEAMLRRLLPAILDDNPLIVVWPDPNDTQLRALLELLPPNLRAWIQWCTCVADVKSPTTARIRIMKDVQVLPNATVFRIAPPMFLQERTAPGFVQPLIDTILEAWAKGRPELDKLHLYLDQSASASAFDYRTLLTRYEEAAQRWQRRQVISRGDWAESAQAHADALEREHDSDLLSAERGWLLPEITRHFDPTVKGDVSMYRQIARRFYPTSQDLAAVGAVAANRAKKGDVELLDAFAKAFRDAYRNDDGPDVIAAMLAGLAQELEPSARSWEFLLALSAKMPVADALRRVAIEQWTFAKPPDWAQVQAFFKMLPLADLDPLGRNTVLVTQVRSIAQGRLMHDLLQLRAKHGTDIQKLPENMAGTPADAILDVLKAGDWPPRLYLLLIAAAWKEQPKAFEKKSGAIAEMFAGMYETDAYTQLSDEERERVKSAAVAVSKSVSDMGGRFELADARRALAAMSANVEKAVFNLARGFVKKQVTGPELERALSESTPAMAWHAYATLYQHDGFDAAAFLKSLSSLAVARAAPMLLAIAITTFTPQKRQRAATVIAACAETLVRSRPVDDRLYTSLQHDWVPKDGTEVEVVMAALSLFAGVRLTDQMRRPLDARLDRPARFKLQTERLRDLFGELKLLDSRALGIVEKDLADAEAQEMAPLRDVLDDAVKYLSTGTLKKPDIARALEIASNMLQNAIDDRRSKR